MIKNCTWAIPALFDVCWIGWTDKCCPHLLRYGMKSITDYFWCNWIHIVIKSVQFKWNSGSFLPGTYYKCTSIKKDILCFHTNTSADEYRRPLFIQDFSPIIIWLKALNPHPSCNGQAMRIFYCMFPVSWSWSHNGPLLRSSMMLRYLHLPPSRQMRLPRPGGQ